MDSVLDAARAGDEAAYSALVAPLRDGLRAHCYRMLGSVHDADDAVQDALVRAWQGIDRFEGRSSVRSWLYRIATRVCLDVVAGRRARALPADLGPPVDDGAHDGVPLTDVAWLQPYPSGPAARYEERESVELAFVAALQHLPGNQRAALLLFDVLGFSAREVAGMMRTSPASVHSALQRARRVVDEEVPEPGQQRTLRTLGDARLRELVERYTAALERGDTAAMVALLTEDVTWAMPPLPSWYRGLPAVAGFLERMPMTRSWRHLPTVANGQPAVACYLWDDAAGAHLAEVVDVLTLRGDRICAVTSFMDAGLFPLFGLPAQHL